MRVEPPFTCPLCHQVRDHAVRCAECAEQVPLDARGRAVPMSSHSVEGGRTAIAASIPGVTVSGVLIGGVALTIGSPALLAASSALAAAGVLAALGYAGATRGDAGARRRHQRAALFWGRPQPIGELASTTPDETMVSIRGRIRLLTPARGEEPNVAARGSGLLGVCGRFVVDDGTGQALVDDDAITVWKGSRWAPRAEGIARDGDQVVVVGPARAAHASERASLGAYRDGGAVIAFDGDATRYVCVLVSP